MVAHSAGLEIRQLPQGVSISPRTQKQRRTTHMVRAGTCVIPLRVQLANVLLKDFDHTLSVVALGLFQQSNVSADIQKGVM